MGWKYKCTYPGCPRVESWGHITLKFWEKWKNQQKKLRENIEIRGNKFQERGVLEAKENGWIKEGNNPCLTDLRQGQ